MTHGTTDPESPTNGPARARAQGFLDVDHIPEIQPRYVRGHRFRGPGNAAQLAAEYGASIEDIRGAARGNRCKAVEGRRFCVRSGKLCRGMCPMHWARQKRYGDPAVKLARTRDEMQAELDAAANSTSQECIILSGYSGRPMANLNGRKMSASRAVWIIANDGEDPGEDYVLHTCHRGDEGCININCLYLGDQKKNVQDMVDSERNSRGEDRWNTTQTKSDVQKIRRLAAIGMKQADIGTRFGLSQSAISRIVNRKNWNWVG